MVNVATFAILLIIVLSNIFHTKHRNSEVMDMELHAVKIFCPLGTAECTRIA